MLVWSLLFALLLPVAVGGVSFWVAQAVSSRLNYFGRSAAVMIAVLPPPAVSWCAGLNIIQYAGSLSAELPADKTSGDGPAFMALMALFAIWWIYSLIVGSIWAVIAFRRHTRQEAIKAVENGTDGPVYGS